MTAPPSASAPRAAPPSVPELQARAAALLPRLRERARAAEEARRLPDETIRELLDAGLFDVQKPVRFGGQELGLVEFVELVATLGRGCGSTAWVYGVTAERAWLLAKFPEAAQREVWATNPRALVTSQINPDGKAVAVPGGWRVTGHWHFVSGIDVAQWAVFCALAPPETPGGPPLALYLLLPVGECEVVDNWHVAGLAATGSRDVRVQDAFVPAYRCVRMLELKEGGGPGVEANPAPLYRLPLISINPYAILAPVLGIAEGALEATLAGARARRLVTTGASAAEQQVVQLRIAEAAAEIDAARALILGDCREAMATVERGEPLSKDLRIRIRRNQAFATRLLVAAVDRLFVVAGGRGIYLDHAMQRAFRDVHAAAAHLGLSWDLAGTMWGQHALGLPLSSTAY
jgi:alkylation response protein AidB-like acyl-CoA dehydrogenase